MKIEDVTQEELIKKNKLSDIDSLAKNFFPDCDVLKQSDSVGIYHKESGATIAYIFPSDSGWISLNISKYENNAILFGTEYERRGLHTKYDSLPCKILKKIHFFDGFMIRKDYSQEESFYEQLRVVRRRVENNH